MECTNWISMGCMYLTTANNKPHNKLECFWSLRAAVFPTQVITEICRYLHGLKGDVDERSLFSEASGSARGVGMEFPLDNTWRLMPPSLSSFPPSKPRNGSILQSNYTQLQSLQDLDSVTIASALPKQQHQQHSFFGSEFGSSEPVKQESQSLRPFFDEWPKARDSWTDLEEERANRNSFSTTQLSISIPMASSDFPTASSRSPNSEYIFSSWISHSNQILEHLTHSSLIVLVDVDDWERSAMFKCASHVGKMKIQFCREP